MTVLTLQWSLKKPPITLSWHDLAKVQPSVIIADPQPLRNPTIIAVAPVSTNGGYFAFNQISAQPTWIIPHNLGRFPSVQIIDLSGNVVEGDVKHLDANVVQIDFSVAVAGSAYLQS